MAKTRAVLSTITLIAGIAILFGCTSESSIKQPIYESPSATAESTPLAEESRPDELVSAGDNKEVDALAPAEEEREKEPTQDPVISWSKVKANSTMESCWIVLEGDVYDFTQVVQQHPFGAQLSNAVCGKDATETFRENADIGEVTKQLQPFLLGSVG